MLPKRYFTDKELGCKCGCSLLPPQKSVDRLYALRILLGFPLPVTSGARCKKYNKIVGGKPGSIHLPEKDRSILGGCGFDIAIPRKETNKRNALVEMAKICGFRGFGYAETFIHIDDALRKTLTDWIY